MDILPKKPFYIYIANFTAKKIYFLKLMIVATASDAPSCIIQRRDDKQYTAGNRGQASMQWDSVTSLHTVHYKPLEHPDKQEDRPNAVR